MSGGLLPAPLSPALSFLGLFLFDVVNQDRVLEAAQFVLRASLYCKDTGIVTGLGFDGFVALFETNTGRIKSSGIRHVLKTS